MLEPNVELGSHIQKLVETTDLIAINKPSGLHSAPLKTSDTSTMLNAVMALHPECSGAHGKKAVEGTLIHRLDQGTSGVLMFARSAKSYQALRTLWSERLIYKDYLAWVQGPLKNTVRMELHLAHSPKSSKRMVVVEQQPAAAARQISKSWETITDILPLAHAREGSLVLVRIHTGVTHQIRATLAALGHPVLGDPVYKAATRPLPPLTKLILAGEDLKSLKTSAALLGSAPVLKKAKPLHALVPDEGFFLHALSLRVGSNKAQAFSSLSTSSVAALKAGIVAPPPIWFGLEKF